MESQVDGNEVTEVKVEASTSEEPSGSVGEKGENGEEGKIPFTRAVRRQKTNGKNGDVQEPKEEFVELKDPIKKRATAMTNSSDHRGIQIGRPYQAPPVTLLDPALVSNDADRDVPVWLNDPKKVDETKLDQFIDEAVGVYRLSLDRALFILTQSDYDINKAREEVKSRKVVEEEWSDDDKIIFRIAFQQYGKNFNKIRQMMPYRSIANIIQFYYHIKKRWKDANTVQTLETVDMIVTLGNNEAPRNPRASELYRRKDKPSFYNALEDFPPIEEIVQGEQIGTCENCGNESRHIKTIETNEVQYMGGGVELRLSMCLLCRQYFEICGILRPTDLLSTLKANSKLKYDRFEPGWKEMLDKFADLSTVVNRPTSQNQNPGTAAISATQKVVTKLDIELQKVNQVIGEKRAACARMEAQLEKEISELENYADLRQRVKEFKVKDKLLRRRDEWTDQEKYNTMHAIWRYDMNWEAVGEMVPTKSRQQLQKFYEMHKKFIDDHAKALKLKKKEQEEEQQTGGQPLMDKIQDELKISDD